MEINSSFIQKLMILYLIIWSISPPLQIDTIYRLAAVGCAAVWIILDIKNGLHLDNIHIYAIVFAVLAAVIAVLQYDSISDILRPISYYFLVIAFIIYHSYKNRWEELRWLVPVVLIFLIIWNYRTLNAISENAAIARLLVRNDAEMYDYMRQGIGGYGLIYPQVCIFPVMVSWTLSAFNKNRVNFIIGVIWLITYVRCILSAGYTIAVVTSVASLVILFFYRKKSIILVALITMSLVLLLVWAIGYVPSFRENLLNVFDGTTVAKKINDIYMSVTTDEMADSINVRLDRYVASVQTMLKYPGIGGLWFSSGGGHSGLLDSFAQYGVWGGILFVKMFYCVPSDIKKNTDNKVSFGIANACLIALILISTLNSITFNFIFVVLIITPVLYNDIKLWRGWQ